jgi:hypothetical protein
MIKPLLEIHRKNPLAYNFAAMRNAKFEGKKLPLKVFGENFMKLLEK